MLNRRNALPPLEILTLSNVIIAQLKTLSSYISASTILSYISFGTEVNTHGLIKSLLNDPTKEVVVPVVADRTQRRLALTTLNDWTDLSTGTYGILEPKGQLRHRRLPGEVDLCLIPGLAFDLYGHRIGYGGGYFDRLLKDIEGNKVGLAYDFQVVDRVPYEQHDEQVDVIVSDKRLFDKM
jgi:5-formyltetrahydrofolate cyclo-ligase